LYMREDRWVHINLVTLADYVNYISQALETIETTVMRLQEELQELRELVTLLPDLASSSNTLGQEIDRVTAAPSVPSVALPPAVPTQLLVAQPVQQAVWLSNHEQLALACQRARDWAEHEHSRPRRNQSL
jgi:hypothetical protein